MVIDAHLHCTGRESSDDVLRSLDEAQVDIGVLLAPFLNGGYSLDDAESLRRANAHLGQLVRGHADRLVGFAVVNPLDPRSTDDLRDAVETLGLRGVKMVPSGWYPYDDKVQPLFAMASELQLPVLFHSGIFIDGRSGRFCRPAFFEVMREHPGTRVALAHVGWPWTDEAIAVGLIDRIHGVPADAAKFRLDISFGPPPPYRLEVLSRAIEVLGAESLQFGSDCFLPCPGSEIAGRMRWVHALFDEMQLDATARERIWSGTAAAWLRLPGPSVAAAGPSGQHQNQRIAEEASLGSGPAGTADVAFSTPFTPPGTARAARSAFGRRHADACPGLRTGWLNGPRRMAPLCC
jgi:predicted TIM-barrel fold metal-dependent hydrolase